ncbi:hypothetical protein SDC9_87575 [bioreactor metagenome]|uniref:Uncharacterized protein n=1 Tax=bioreactor metagenome TaxID=1076179 RepID=A0A644ZJ80_9ZZZZ
MARVIIHTRNSFLYRKGFFVYLFILEVRLVYRQPDKESSSFINFALHRNASAVQLNQVFCQRQTNAGSNGIKFTVISFIKSLEKILLSFLGNTLTVVSYS